MALSEDAKFFIAALSYRAAILGAVLALFGGMCAYDAYGERIFENLWTSEESAEGAKLGLGIGLSLMGIFPLVLYLTRPRGNTKPE